MRIFSAYFTPLLIGSTCFVAACSGDEPPSPGASIDSGKDVTLPPPNPEGGDDDAGGPSDVAPDATLDDVRDVSRESNVADASTNDTSRTDVVAEGGNDIHNPPDANIVDAGVDLPRSDDANRDGGGSTPGLWLKGDLHVHCKHSTDAMDTTVAEAFAKAESLGFDYFVLTDHDNHVEGKISTWSDPDYRSDKMVLLYGAEWTTGIGHANIFGTKPYDYAPIWAARDGDSAVSIATAHAQGLHFSVNHPAAKDLWEGGFDRDFDSMEVWTAPFVIPNSNTTAIAKWDEILLGGRRLGVRGGSDSHHQHDFESTLFNIGNPTTWIRAQEKTGEALLAALKAGHVSVSYAATAERLDFTSDVDGDGVFESVIGDNVQPVAGKPLSFKIEIAGFRATSTYNLTVFKNGVSFKNWPMLTTASVAFEDTPTAGERAYYRVELRGPTSDAPILGALGFGDFIALTNPIYVSYP
ncbi:MAG: CehA/McbA family metallohydrolase [Polyangiaceae bacterium]